MAKREQTRFCHYEDERFPAEEFVHTEQYGWVHNRDPRHSLLGAQVDDKPPDKPKEKIETIPGPMKRA
jgi:hypothetical protein